MTERTDALVEASSRLVLAEHVDPRGTAMLSNTLGYLCRSFRKNVLAGWLQRICVKSGRGPPLPRDPLQNC